MITGYKYFHKEKVLDFLKDTRIFCRKDLTPSDGLELISGKPNLDIKFTF